MKLGAFSISLNVGNLKASQKFYTQLGFKVFGGALEKNYSIMKNDTTLIGLFHGMFKKNMLTFNPGWDEDANKIESFTDIRVIHRQLKEKNVKFETEADETNSGPDSFRLVDSDGNPILVDQHV